MPLARSSCQLTPCLCWLRSAPGLSIYEDDDEFDDDVPLLNDEDDAELLDEGQPVISGGRSVMLEEKKNPLDELLTSLVPVDIEEFNETAWYVRTLE